MKATYAPDLVETTDRQLGEADYVAACVFRTLEVFSYSSTDLTPFMTASRGSR